MQLPFPSTSLSPSETPVGSHAPSLHPNSKPLLLWRSRGRWHSNWQVTCPLSQVLLVILALASVAGPGHLLADPVLQPAQDILSSTVSPTLSSHTCLWKQNPFFLACCLLPLSFSPPTSLQAFQYAPLSPALQMRSGGGVTKALCFYPSPFRTMSSSQISSDDLSSVGLR